MNRASWVFVFEPATHRRHSFKASQLPAAPGLTRVQRDQVNAHLMIARASRPASTPCSPWTCPLSAFAGACRRYIMQPQAKQPCAGATSISNEREDMRPCRYGIGAVVWVCIWPEL